MTFIPINNYTFIANCDRADLLAQRLNRLVLLHTVDSPSIFAVVLDDERGRNFAFTPQVLAGLESCNLVITNRQQKLWSQG